MQLSNTLPIVPNYECSDAIGNGYECVRAWEGISFELLLELSLLLYLLLLKGAKLLELLLLLLLLLRRLALGLFVCRKQLLKLLMLLLRWPTLICALGLR